jgi:FkbM family methyltransferase
MKFFRIVNKAVSFLFFLFQYRSWKVAYIFSHHNVPLYASRTIRKKGGNLLFVATGNELPIAQLGKFRKGLDVLFKVLDHKGIRLVSPDRDHFILEAGGIRLPVHSLNNIYIICELFIDMLYNVNSSQDRVVVIDIGMNVGFASLFFAALDKVEKVYSFEPFQETFQEAIDNFDLNQHLKKKIQPFNYGISNYSGNAEVPLLEGGSVVASTNSAFIENHHIQSSRTIQVKVENIEEVLGRVLADHGRQPVFLKVDCEGEEYNIMEVLEKGGYLSRINGFFMEWHFKGPGPLTRILNANHFVVFDIPRTNDPNCGMLYAFRESS